MVRPLMMDPSAPLPDEPLPFEPAEPGTAALALDDLGPDAGRFEGKGGMWYATRVQSIVLVERPKESSGKVRVVFREREAYTLQDGTPRWSGDERIFEFDV